MAFQFALVGRTYPWQISHLQQERMHFRLYALFLLPEIVSTCAGLINDRATHKISLYPLVSK
jgi:hypothetical protein